MPGALTPMSVDMFHVLFDVFITRMLRSRMPEIYDWSLYAPRTSCCIGKKMFVNFSPNLIGSARRSLDQQVLMTYGSQVKELEVYTRGIIHPSVTPNRYKAKAARYSLKFMFSIEDVLRKGNLVAKNFSIELPASGSTKDRIVSFASQLQKMRNSFPYLTAATIASQNWNMAVVALLKSSLGEQ
ncbi:hypothetical protein BIW11_00792, partial [Tropilaelaps mercedesae]